MLKYNFERIFRARGIEKPFSFLRKAGFSDYLATKIKQNKVARLNSSSLERLCIVLKCSPNDLFEWIPGKQTLVDSDHPLNDLKKSDRDVDLTTMINTIPYGELEEIENLIKEKINKKST